jgi:hypothetical protein
MSLMNPQLLWLLLLLPFFFGAWRRWGRRTQTLKNTQMAMRIGLRSRLARALDAAIWICKTTVWTALVLAVCVTSYSAYVKVFTSHGTIYLAADTSASFGDAVTNPEEVKLASHYDAKWKDWKWDGVTAAFEKPSNGYDTTRKATGNVPLLIEVAAGVIKDLAEEDHYLSMGLLAADDNTYYLYPATKDHELIVNLLPDLVKYMESNGKGDNFCGPEFDGGEVGLGQAIVDLFEHVPVDGPHIFGFVSDGDFLCSEGRKEYLKKEFERLHIHMVVLGAGEDWATGKGEAPAFMDFLKKVNGDLIPLQDPVAFKKGWENVKQLANSGVHSERSKHRQDALIVLLSVAFGALVAALILSWIRRASSL